MIEYRTLNVRVEHLHEQAYEAIVQGPGGDGRVRFEIPTDMPDLEAVAMAVSRPRSARRRIESGESAMAREFGARLFDLVFQGTARDVMRMSLAEARSDEQGLRMMLDLEGAPHLRNVPWELLWDRPKFVSTSVYTPVVRYVDLPIRARPLDVKPPLRVLGMVSSPGDVRALDTDTERALLNEACGALDEQDLLAIEWVEEATLRGLLERLNDGTAYHVFHFIGHGDFDESADDGVLLFEGPAGRSHRVTGTELGTILADHRTLRLAVINACEGARVADDWGGIAGSLMQYGLPAVIAMQFEISDDAALSFARGFYASVARNHPVDEALGDARRGMFADGYGLEWATPAMFTSVADCRLFDVRWEQASDERDAPLSKLSVDLTSEPSGAGEVTWRLELVNEGALELSELQPLAGDGRPLSKPFALASGERRTIEWEAEPGEAVVSVAGADSHGRIVSERATAVAEAAPVPEEPKAVPPPEPEPPAREHAARKPAPRPRPKPSGERPPALAAERDRPLPADRELPRKPTRPARRRRALAGAALALVVVGLVAALSTGGGGGSHRSGIVARIPLPSDAGTLAADADVAVVSGTGNRLTDVNLHDRPETHHVHGLGTGLNTGGEGRSIALTASNIWIDSDPDHIAALARDGSDQAQRVRLGHSTYHLLEASSDALWTLAPDVSEIGRLTIGSSRLYTDLLPIARGSASELAVTSSQAYVLHDNGASKAIYTVDRDLSHGIPPVTGLSGSAIGTADGYLMIVNEGTLQLVPIRGGGPHSIEIGTPSSAYDVGAGRVWVAYPDGTLKRFGLNGEPAGRPLDLGGKPVDVQPGKDRAWVLIEKGDGKKELLDVRP